MKNLFLILTIGALFSFLIGCEGSVNSLSKSASVVMYAKNSSGSGASLSSIPVIGGTLNIQSAYLYVDEIEIEEDTSPDDNQQSSSYDDDMYDDSNDDNSDDSSDDDKEISIHGPFTLDISTDSIQIANVPVYPGTFNKVELEFMVSNAMPFDGNSIVISGEYTPAGGGNTIPFVLKSDITGKIHCSLAGDCITIIDNTTVKVAIEFDIAKWFDMVDFSNATDTNGAIEINSMSNVNLLTMFETNFQNSVSVDDDPEIENEMESGS